MQRISALDPAAAPAAIAATLNGVKAKLGSVPNLIQTMARSPVVLNAYLAYAGAIGRGRLPSQLRERISLVTAETNNCDYCASAHQALGKMAGLSDDEIARAFRGDSSDPKVKAALTFAKSVLAKRGQVSDEELAAVKAAGFPEEETIEIVGNVVLNIFTNYFNNVVDTDIDYPRISTSKAAA
jgi:uncharacterized peroxidase-related enzyme